MQGIVRTTILLAVSCLPAGICLAEPATSVDVRAFLQQHQLGDYHTKLMEFLAAISDEDVAQATRVFAETLPRKDETMPEVVKQLAVTAAARTSRGIQDLEYVGFSRFSSRFIALHIMIHAQDEPLLLTVMVYRREQGWASVSWSLDWAPQIISERLKRSQRFSGKTIVSLPADDKTAARSSERESKSLPRY